jgi:hypothetical protein
MPRESGSLETARTTKESQDPIGDFSSHIFPSPAKWQAFVLEGHQREFSGGGIRAKIDPFL